LHTSAFKQEFGPVALVTGASSGIGWSFAEQLAVMGFDLVLVARRVDRLQELAARLQSEHRITATVLAVDLAEHSAAQQILDATASLDIGLVVSNAGYGFKGEHAATDPDGLTAMLMVNCDITMRLAHGFIPRLRQRGKGGLILTSSVEGLIGCPYSAGYSASKAFVKAFGEALWGELTPEGIKVLTICPGATATEAAQKQGVDPATMQNVMQPDAVARLALENIDNGPTLVTSDHYRAMFEQLTAMPRREALAAMAGAMKR
jgi:short-subunit dehydrogenase